MAPNPQDEAHPDPGGSPAQGAESNPDVRREAEADVRLAEGRPETGMPSADPGSDHVRLLREIRESQPKLGCLGVVITGWWRIVAAIAVVLLLVYVIGRLGP